MQRRDRWDWTSRQPHWSIGWPITSWLHRRMTGWRSSWWSKKQKTESWKKPWPEPTNESGQGARRRCRRWGWPTTWPIFQLFRQQNILKVLSTSLTGTTPRNFSCWPNLCSSAMSPRSATWLSRSRRYLLSGSSPISNISCKRLRSRFKGAWGRSRGGTPN